MIEEAIAAIHEWEKAREAARTAELAALDAIAYLPGKSIVVGKTRYTCVPEQRHVYRNEIKEKRS
jgi:hypothetical protein